VRRDKQKRNLVGDNGRVLLGLRSFIGVIIDLQCAPSLKPLCQIFDQCWLRTRYVEFLIASLVTSKPANGGQIKTGKRIEPETMSFYLFDS
jgi:hypothetical protein